MTASTSNASEITAAVLCPNLAEHWQIGQLKRSQQYVLTAKTAKVRYLIEAPEAYALQHFNGKYTIAQIQQKCQKQFTSEIPPDLVLQLLQKLVNWGVIQDKTSPVSQTANPSPASPFKACIQWIQHPEGYWILRNPEDVTFMQVDSQSKQAIEMLGKYPTAEISQQTGISAAQMKYLMQLLTVTAMLEGTKPPKPPKKPFTPMKLLFFKVPLFNPDPWLNRPTEALGWLWTKPFFLLLLAFLSVSAVVGLNWRSQILLTGGILWETQGATLVIPFGLLAMLVVTIHEFGHALTLKHYGGIVPEIGFLFMFLMPAAYTNTSDSYCLVKRRQRVFVVGAGVLCQFIIGAIAFWLWCTSVESSWLHPISYLLMVSALFTVAVNLNPMAKFDGYYLTVAATGINNLRTRSFQFYQALFSGKPSPEIGRDRAILAAYAPLSFLYILMIFGSLFRMVAFWTFDNAPVTVLLLLIGWAVYYFWPRG
ncbi:MAG: M50 family metallopeptidase [Jaaginema sp. PMC 1079.18]|nr:M50 family metallopeptidase [Jaaginema sp. PMC 1080.18]MEC4852692.1 M50 family metallopeptidase [Jaaginema sp. PMC 1079.18]MEC4867234.1 M50 family metallopeptidase [Jaaginema sp. PMC 1078.18]